jgi:hypothetical protein
MKNIWLDSGGFIEASFLLPNSGNRLEQITSIFQHFEAMGFVCNNDNVPEILSAFAEGYVEIDDTENTRNYQERFSFKVEVGEERLANAVVIENSSSLLQVDLYFSHDDDMDLEPFYDLLKKLYFEFRFPFGTLGIEQCCLDVFEWNVKDAEVYYRLENIRYFPRITEPYICSFLAFISEEKLLPQNHKYQTIEIDRGVIFTNKQNL